MNIPKYLIIHHEGVPVITNKPRFQAVNQFHKENFDMLSTLGFYCGYHYFIEKDGTLIQARADNDEGAHTKGYNLQSLGICLAGNFDLELPTSAQTETLRKLMEQKIQEYSIPLVSILPHRHFANKSCYGRNLSDSWARNLITIPATRTCAEVVEEQKDVIAKLIALIRGYLKG